MPRPCVWREPEGGGWACLPCDHAVVRTELTRGRVQAARAIAIIADVAQIGLFPLFIEGALSTVNDVVDVVVCAAMVWLVGWHWAFLPSVVAETVPALNLAPTWTAAVLFATRGMPGAPAPPATPIPPAVPDEHVIDVEGRPVP